MALDVRERQNQKSKEKLKNQKNVTQPKLRSNRKELKFYIVFANFICGLPTDKTQTPSRIFGGVHLTMQESWAWGVPNERP